MHKIHKYIKLFLSTALLSSSLTLATESDVIPYIGKPGQFELSLTIPASDLKDALSSRFPSLFSGRSECSEIPYIIARKLTHSLHAKTPKIMVPEARPLFELIRTHIRGMTPTHPQLQLLVGEIDDDMSAGRFDIVKLYSYGFRVLGAISTEPTKNALAPFTQFNGEQVDREMRATWQSPFSLYTFNRNQESFYRSFSHNISSRLRELLDEQTAKTGRPSLNYPVFGKGKLGLATLIGSFINRIYPMPISDKPQTAHGIQMTPLLFGYHDYLHGDIDSSAKGASFDTAAYYKLAALATDKIDAEELIKPVANFMVTKSNLIEDTMRDLLDLYFTYYLSQHLMTEVKKAMVGFFFTLHEELNVSHTIFDMHNFDDILKFLLGDLQDKLSEASEIPEVGGEKLDILQTDPLSGKTSLNPEQALDAILAAGLRTKEQRTLPSDFLFKRADLEGKKYRIDINQQPMITTVTVKIAGGMEHTWEVLTLKYALASSLDHLSLLKTANIKMTPPSMDDLATESGRKIALAYLAQVDKKLRFCQKAFETSALELIGAVPTGRNESLWQKFWNKSQKLAKQLQDEAPKVK